MYTTIRYIINYVLYINNVPTIINPIFLGSQKLRTSLYSSFIALINLLATYSQTLTNGNIKQKNILFTSTNKQILNSKSIEFIKSLNFDQYLSVQILEIICVDLTSGHDICKVFIILYTFNSKFQSCFKYNLYF